MIGRVVLTLLVFALFIAVTSVATVGSAELAIMAGLLAVALVLVTGRRRPSLDGRMRAEPDREGRKRPS